MDEWLSGSISLVSTFILYKFSNYLIKKKVKQVSRNRLIKKVRFVKLNHPTPEFLKLLSTESDVNALVLNPRGAFMIIDKEET